VINQALGLPEVASEHGLVVDHMLEMLTWFMLILGIGWSIYFVYCLFRFHRKANPVADYMGVRSHASTHLEIGVVIVEAVLLLGFAFPFWSVRANQFPTGPDVVKVRAVGYQFGWVMHYPGPDGLFGQVNPRHYDLATAEAQAGVDTSDPNAQDDIFLINELLIPVDRPVIVEVTSRDVIHSFALKEMRIAQDAIPGQDIQMWFTPTKTGEYDIICGQLCGDGHARMTATLRVIENDQFVADFETADGEEEAAASLIVPDRDANLAASAGPAAR